MFLQETHSTETESKTWHRDLQAKIGYWDHGENNARGAGIIIGKEIETEEIWINETSYNGRAKAIVIKWRNQKIGLISIYAPNISWGKKSELEYNNFINSIQGLIDTTSKKADFLIIGGDFNIVQSKWDLQDGKGELHIDCINKVQECMGKHKLIDIYREENPRKTITTYTQYGKSKEEKRRRLDYIYISERIKKATKVSLNKTITNTDHNLLQIELKNNDFRKRNNGIWRHNNLLNKDEVFIEKLKKMIEKINYEDLQSNQSKWEYTKYKIGQFSREYSIKRAKEKKENNRGKLKELEKATDEYGNRRSEITEKKFRELKIEVQKMLEEEEKAIIFRARTKFYEEGEKCTAYFFNQIKANRKASNINSLKREDGTVLKGNEVGKEIYDFYEKLYQNYDSKEHEYEKIKRKFLGKNIEQKISIESSRELDKELTKEELKNALFTSMKEGKAPGNDGLTSGLYRAIWDKVDNLFFEATKEALEKGTLTTTQRQSIIRLIEKKGKNREEIKNWRPISLINVDTKIIAKAIANRLKKTIQDIIGKEQTGFLKNRYIGENIRLTEYLIEKYKKKRKEGYIVAIDFQKAFDSCSHRYLKDVLKAYGFGDNFIKFIELLYNDAESAVLNEGISTKYFKIKRSCRQGDPISPYLFIIMLEPLLSRIRQEEEIRGLRTRKNEVKAAAFADDLTTSLANKKSILALLQVLEEFKIVSGLKINRDKTELLQIMEESNNSWIKEIGLKQVKTINITGVYQGTDKETIDELNWERIVEKTKFMLNRWKGRDLSLMGRLMIVKAQGISQIQYLASNIIMPQIYVKKINRLLYNFIWKGPDKMKRNIVKRGIKQGGLAMPDAAEIAKAASIQWIGRGERWADKYWNDFLEEDLDRLGGKSCLNSRPHRSILLANKSFSFNEYIFKNWWEQVRPPEKEEPELLLGVNIWTDERIKTPKHDDLRALFIKNKIARIDDFIDERGEVKRKPEKERSNINILNWIRATKRIPKEWTEVISKWTRDTEGTKEIRKEMEGKIIIKTKKGALEASKMTQKIIRENQISLLKREETKYRDKLAIEYGTTAMEWTNIDRRIISHSISTKSRSFLFRFYNGLTYNNKDFKRFGYKEEDNCSFCKQEKQTNTHLFWECRETRKLWEEITKHLTQGSIRKREVFLGENEGEDKLGMEAKNNIIAFTLQYIYTANYKEKKLTIGGLWEKMKYIKRVEEEVAINRNNIISYLTKWESIEEILKPTLFELQEQSGSTQKDSRQRKGAKKRKRDEEEDVEEKEEEEREEQGGRENKRRRKRETR